MLAANEKLDEKFDASKIVTGTGRIGDDNAKVYSVKTVNKLLEKRITGTLQKKQGETLNAQTKVYTVNAANQKFVSLCDN